MNFPIPENEIERLKALHEYHLLDTLPEEQFDRLTKLASIICDVPIVLISLVDKNRQWFKSKVGLAEDETKREISLCQYTIMGKGFFEIEDTIKDERFNENPLVLAGPKIRFYAAYPLIDPNGFALGSLCVIDKKPKKLTSNQIEALKTLAEDIMLQIVAKKESVERLKLEKFYLMSMDMICIAGLDGYFKKVNPAFTATLGWSEKELLDTPLIEFVHPDDRTKTELVYNKLKEGHSAIDFYNRYRTKDNSYRLLEWVVTPDLVTGELFAIIRDNTVLKRIKAENEESATVIEQLNSALNESAIVTVTDSDGKIEFVNDAFCEVSKFSREELIGQDHRILQSGVHSETFIKEMWRTIQDGRIWKGEFQNKCKDGSSCWLETTIIPFLDINKKPVRFVAIRYDVTERVSLENALRKSKYEIENTAKIKEQFLANMSHEIRTPLNAIIGFSEILRASKLTPTQADHAMIITKSGENLMCIINDILDFTKIESGNIVLEKVPFDVVEIVDNIKKMFKNTAGEKKIGLKVFIDDELPTSMIGDPARLTQILINLVGNAIKFTNIGSVEIYSRLVFESVDQYLIEIKVKDTGVGIQSDKLEVIFDRFVQAEDDTTRMFGGTGLGLSIVKNIVKLMNGEISVVSEFGFGSEFSIQIAFGKCSALQIEAFESQKSKPVFNKELNLGMLSILLVEDNRMNQQYVNTLMKQFGYKCTVAADGNAAINLIRENKYDLILMDVQMPLMDGYEASRIIRQELKNNTPIIALTANTTMVDYEKCIKVGMNGYLSKPYKPEDLQRKIAHTLVPSENINVDIDGSLKTDTVVDFDCLKKQVNGKLNAVQQLLNIFIEDTPRDLKELDAAIEKINYSIIESISHQLISTFSIMGISSVIALLKAMELNAGKKQNLSLIKNNFKKLMIIAGKARVEVESYKLIKQD